MSAPTQVTVKVMSPAEWSQFKGDAMRYIDAKLEANRLIAGSKIQAKIASQCFAEAEQHRQAAERHGVAAERHGAAAEQHGIAAERHGASAQAHAVNVRNAENEKTAVGSQLDKIRKMREARAAAENAKAGASSVAPSSIKA